MVLSFFFVVAAILIVRAALAPYQEDNNRLRASEERMAFLQGRALDHLGWLYGTPRRHNEPDVPYRKRLAAVRARSFAV